MSKKIKVIIQVVIIVLIMAGLGYYFYTDYQKSQAPYDSKIEILKQEAEIIKQITTLTFIKQDLTEEMKAKYQKSFDKATGTFLDHTNDPEGFWPLIEIEQVKQLAGDYDGAKQAMLWAAQLQPDSYLIHGNLGYLYFRHYQDFAKAEEHYLKAIEPDDPRVINYYYDLHEIYRYFYKTEANLAEEILLQGIEKYPEDTGMLSVLSRYYIALDRKEDSREIYLQILELDPDDGPARQGLRNL